jgi:hypothetical protein
MAKYVSPQKREQSGMAGAYAAVLIDSNTIEVTFRLSTHMSNWLIELLVQDQTLGR